MPSWLQMILIGAAALIKWGAKASGKSTDEVRQEVVDKLAKLDDFGLSKLIAEVEAEMPNGTLGE